MSADHVCKGERGALRAAYHALLEEVYQVILRSRMRETHFILSPQWETVSQFVIPAKAAYGGREPGSRQRPRESGEPDIK